MKHTIYVHLQRFPSAPTMGTSNKHNTFHQCCFIVPASVEDHGTTLIHQRRKVSCFLGAMYEDGRTHVQEDCCLGIPGTHACCTSRQSLGQQQIIYNSPKHYREIVWRFKTIFKTICMFALWPPHQTKHQIDYNNCGLLCFAQHSKKTQGNSYSLLIWMMTITLMMTSLILICCHPSTHKAIL